MGGEKWPPDRGLPPRLTEGEWREQLAGGGVRRDRATLYGTPPSGRCASLRRRRPPRQVRHCSCMHASDLMWMAVPMLVLLSLFAIARFLVKIF